MRPFRPSSLVLMALSLTALGACAATHDALLGPKMSPMGYPAALVAAEQPVVLPASDSRQHSAPDRPTRFGAPARGPSSPTSGPPGWATS